MAERDRVRGGERERDTKKGERERGRERVCDKDRKSRFVCFEGGCRYYTASEKERQ